MSALTKVWGWCQIAFGDTWSSPTSDQRIYFDGSDNIAKSNYGTALTGDLQFQAKIRATDYTPSAGQIIGGHWGAAGDKGWSLWLHTDGTLVLGISADGTNVDWKGSTAALPSVTDNVTDIWVRVVFDANDGAGKYVVKFYTSSNGSSWTQLGANVETAGTYTIFSPTTAKFAVGAADHPAEAYPDGFTGRIYQASFWSDMGTTLVAHPDFSTIPWETGSTAEVDAQGNTWTLTGATVQGSFAYAWTDATDDLRGFSLSWGRGSEYDAFRAGTCTVVLNNRSRQYEPEYAGGANYPNVKPWVPIKVGVTFTDGSSTTTACLFSGFVERWVLRYPGMGADAQVQVQATDGLKIPANYKIGVALSSGTPGAMLTTALNKVGWGTSTLWRSLSSGTVALDGTATSSTGEEVLLTLMSKVVNSDGGWLYSMPHSDGHTPRIVFRNRTWPAENNTICCTFGETSAYTRYTDLQLSYDEERIRNRWRVGILASTKVAVSSDTGSQNLYGLRVYEQTGLLLPNTSAADDRTVRGVHTTATPALSGNVRSFLRVGMDYDRAVDLAVDAYGPLRWVRVLRGGVDEQMTVDGCSVSFRVGEPCEFDYTLSPASFIGTYWILGDSALGRLDETAYLGW